MTEGGKSMVVEKEKGFTSHLGIHKQASGGGQMRKRN
jgi:hypothetical protein